jgi:hypothetical protein
MRPAWQERNGLWVLAGSTVVTNYTLSITHRKCAFAAIRMSKSIRAGEHVHIIQYAAAEIGFVADFKNVI